MKDKIILEYTKHVLELVELVLIILFAQMIYFYNQKFYSRKISKKRLSAPSPASSLGLKDC